ncbi:hypothetical protein [Photobacterium damselae]|uniref:hypothetical protein n=1 Tax=Photobacterium damselae TaxID=38293 RepID=UPI001F3019EA|nr:hypothetical protein [Photobacterium damselae]UKA04497.1 hypothetical protein IHC89_23010 [Photobacterium damselae subsp. damselae]
MTFKFHKPDISTVIQFAVPKKQKSKLSFSEKVDLCHATLSKLSPDYFVSLQFSLLCNDVNWINDGKKIVFIDELLAKRLISSSAKISKAKSKDFVFTLPFKSFMVSLPEIAIEGTKIPPFICYISTRRQKLLDLERAAKSAQKVKECNQTPIDIGADDPTHHVDNLAFYYRVNGTQIATQILAPEEIYDLLNAESAEDYVELRKNKKLDCLAADLTAEETKIGYYIFKLLVSLSIYQSATGGINLHSGLPKVKSIQGLSESIRVKSNTNLYHITSHRKHEAPTESYIRGWHFRHLVAERYYKGEFSNYAPNSRWTIVSEAVVTPKDVTPIDPYTLKNN